MQKVQQLVIPTRCFRLLHKPTGLYFCPVRKIQNLSGQYVKSQLSKIGKIYYFAPTNILRYILETGHIYTHLHNFDGDVTMTITSNDWEICS